MIGIQLQGQLGNQLFQLAFIRSASKTLHEIYAIIDDKAYGCIIEKYFVLRFYEKRYFRKIMQKIFFLRQREIIEFNNWQEPEKILQSLNTSSLYKGFFQSEKFFKNIIGTKPFRVKEKYKKIFYQKYGELFKHNNIILIHIRLKDYLEIGTEEFGGKGLQLPFEYYRKAIEHFYIDEKTKVLVISDDINYVRQNFKLNVPFTIEENHFIIDFLLLINANGLIISNSTFSWWGAFLNTNKNLKIVAPEFWLGFKIFKTYPVGIICNSWTTLQVNS